MTAIKGNAIEGEAGASAPAARAAATQWLARRRVFIDVTALVLGATVLGWRSFGWPLVTLDESILLVYPEQVRAGLVPHRDFFTVYGPAPFYLLAWLFDAFGSALAVARGLGLVLHLVIVIGCYTIGRSRGRAAGLLAGWASLVLLLPLGTVPYAWLGAMACVVVALALTGRTSATAHMWGGAAAGLVPAFRPELLVITVPVLLSIVWRSPTWRRTLAGFAVGLTPLLAFALVAGQRMWWNIGPGRAGVNGALDPFDTPAQSFTILAAVLGATGTLIWLAYTRRTRLALTHALVALGILPQTLQRVDPDHAFYTLCVTIPLVITGTWVARPSAASTRRRNLLAIAMVIAMGVSLAAVVLRPAPPTVTVQLGGRSAILAASQVSDLLATRAELIAYSPPGGSLFVGSTDMSKVSLSQVPLYYLTPELRPKAYYLELAVGVSERSGSGLVRDIQDADVLLLSPRNDDLMRHLYPYLAPGSDEANAVVRDKFCRVAETGWGVIYVRRPCADPVGH